MEKEKALNRAAALCSTSEQCAADMRDRLLRWGATHDDAAWVVGRLVDERFIDDRRYARAFAHDRLRYHRWGRVKIAYALRQKGIGQEAVAEALDALDNEWADEYDEALAATLAPYLPAIAQTSDDWTANQKAKAKAIRHAASHGFTSDEITTKMRPS